MNFEGLEWGEAPHSNCKTQQNSFGERVVMPRKFDAVLFYSFSARG
jgi:hypothetical protein